MRPRNQLLWYFALAFGIAWSGVLVSDGRISWFVAMLLGPTLASLLMIGWLDRARGLRELTQRLLRWRVPAVWYITPLVAPAILLAVLGLLSYASASFTPAIAAGGSPSEIIVSAVAVGMFAGIFEEIGWTGFATPRLLRRYSWWDTGLILGVPWALWHMLPDFLGRSMPVDLWFAHALQWLLALVAFRVFMTWVYSHTSSLFLAILLHATFAGSQVLLWPASTAPSVELLWYGLFALELWLLVAFVSLVGEVFASVAASKVERVRPLLGDVLVPHPMFSITHAITIDRPPQEVWPWLTQMGSDRAGWYSYDRVDNAGHHSSDWVIEDYQDVRPGDVLSALPGASDAFRVTAIEPARDLVLTVPGPDGPVVSWEHFVEPTDDGRTRLIVRGRIAKSWKQLARGAAMPGEKRRFIEYVYRALGRLPDALTIPFARLGHRWMEARHMRGIKRRVESFA